VLEWQELLSQDILNVFRGQPSGTVDPSLVSVTVWNGSGTPGQAGDAKLGLERTGFEVPEIDDAPDTVDATVVRYAPGMESVATLVARYLERGATVEEDDSLDAQEVVLVTGPEFGEVLAEPLDEVATPPSTADATSSGGSDGSTDASASSASSGGDDQGAPQPTADGDEPRSTTTTSAPAGLVPSELAPDGC